MMSSRFFRNGCIVLFAIGAIVWAAAAINNSIAASRVNVSNESADTRRDVLIAANRAPVAPAPARAGSGSNWHRRSMGLLRPLQRLRRCWRQLTVRRKRRMARGLRVWRWAPHCRHFPDVFSIRLRAVKLWCQRR